MNDQSPLFPSHLTPENGSTSHLSELVREVAMPSGIFIPDDPDEPGPTGPSLPPSLSIEIQAPAVGTALQAPASQGVIVTVIGYVDFEKHSIDNVRVTFSGIGAVTATLDRNSFTWVATSPKITTAGNLTIRAQVNGTNLKTNEAASRTDLRTIRIELSDNVPPSLTINSPANNTLILPQNVPPPNKAYSVMLRATASDPQSGVERLEFSLNGSNNWQKFTEQPSANVWEHNLRLDFQLQAQTITVRAIDRKGNISPSKPDGSDRRSVRTVDNIPPTLTVLSPKDQVISLPIGANGSALLRELLLEATDKHSGVGLVEWALVPPSGSPVFKAADKVSSKKWRVRDIVVPGPVGPKRIRIRAADKAGAAGGSNNQAAEVEIQLAVTETYPPKDPTVQEYFASLVDFTIRRFVKPGGAALTIADLVGELRQPFDRLLGAIPAGAANPASQLRLLIEILRRHFDGLLPGAGAPAAALERRRQGEAAYHQAAYDAVLRRFGVTRAELRMAQVGDLASATTIAQRLGIPLRPLRTTGPGAPKSTLELFTATGKDVTEIFLEQRFGVPDFNRDPLADVAFVPTLLLLQEELLEQSWQAQDEASFGAIIDPDVIGSADLAPGAHPAATLLQARKSWLDALLAAYRVPVTRGISPQERLEHIVGEALVPMENLLRLHQRQQAGENIEPTLTGLHLSQAAFDRLIDLHKLASAGSLGDAEWEDVYAILIQAQKLRSLPSWRMEEQRSGLVLGPDFFRLGPPALADAPLAPWRHSPRERQRWRAILSGRIEQRLALQQALKAALDGAQEEVLPALRDGLVAALGLLAPAVASPNLLAARLHVDVDIGAFPRITRLELAIQSLQSLLFALRTEQQTGWSRNGNFEKQEEFDEELRWIGSYATWQSAMQAYLNPENQLLPTLRSAQATADFLEFLRKVRRHVQLMPEQAQALALDFGNSNEDGDLILVRDRKALNERRERCQSLVLANTGGSSAQLTNLERLSKVSVRLRELFYFVPLTLALQLHRSGQYLAALDWFRMVYAYDLPIAERKVWHGLALERDPQPQIARSVQRSLLWLKEALNPHEIVVDSYPDAATARYDAYTRFTVMALARCLLDFADAEFAQDINESLPRARALYAKALELIGLPELNPVRVPGLSANAATGGLKLRAETALAKLRTGRNIAGLLRQVESIAPLGGVAGSLPAVASAAPFGSTSLRALQPTPYRYVALIERAKQLVILAQQIEQSYLSAVEKRDNEAYNLLKAKQDLALAHLQVQLQDLRLTEADDGITLAEAQLGRAEFQVESLQELLDASMNQWERRLLEDYKVARDARNRAAMVDAAISAAQALTAAASGGFLGTGIGVANYTSAAATTALAFLGASRQIEASNIEARTQEHNLRAGIENRRIEWTHQLGIAQKDVTLAQQQQLLADDRRRIVALEGVISQLQFAQAQATIDFLANKFTNLELYEWMSGVLQEVYAYLLLQASGVARLAQNQLAFERQEALPNFIQRDYWQASTDGAISASGPDRGGLTGSARLLQDLIQLDQFAFTTDQRKLQLSKTISLARLAPLEFQAFRNTGNLTFATPMRLFDQDFPGHYLRLIKRVRVSVVALVPPHEGIRATLSTTGTSRVVIGGDSFQTVHQQRLPEEIALTSPINASGMLELEARPELLQPFEFMGVDALWNFALPKAANPFDFRTIADVLITLDYTALSDIVYRQKVIQQLDRELTASRSFSIRDAFPDQWYDLHNPEQAATPLTVTLPIGPEDFPSNLSGIALRQVAVYVVAVEDRDLPPIQLSLHLSPQTGGNLIGGEASTTVQGIASTRLGNAPSWLPLINAGAFGSWQLRLVDTAATRRLLADELIDDIVVALTFNAQTPPWSF